ncbi:MAG: hypothetical protein QM758_23050 [Armatimonas sp.]
MNLFVIVVRPRTEQGHKRSLQDRPSQEPAAIKAEGDQEVLQQDMQEQEGRDVSKVLNPCGPLEYLCGPCMERLKVGDYCYYCYQIYFEENDGTDWIMCDKCQKWVHFDCEEKLGDQFIKAKMLENTDLNYYCPKCKPLKQVASKKGSMTHKRTQAD